MRLEPRLDLQAVDIAVQRRQQGNRETEVDDGGGTPLGRPAFFWGVGAAVDGGRLPSGAGLGCRGAGGIVESSGQGCQVSPHLLYYMRLFM